MLEKHPHRQSSELTMSILTRTRVRSGLLLSERAIAKNDHWGQSLLVRNNPLGTVPNGQQLVSWSVFSLSGHEQNAF